MTTASTLALPGFRPSPGSVLAFLAPVLTTLLLWAVLPASFDVSENADYRVFYEPVARNLLDGRGLTNLDGSPAVRYPPGYPVVLAGLFGVARALRAPEGAVLDLFALLCVGATSLVLYGVARRLWSGRAALLPSLAWSAYPIALWFTKQPADTKVAIAEISLFD